MNLDRARELLLLYRHETGSTPDPDTAAALALLDEDKLLGEWYERERAFQQAFREQLRNTPVPPDLRERILAGSKVAVLPSWWRRPSWLATAAAIVLLLGLGLWELRRDVPDRFAHFRARMVATVLREYQMDIRTNSMEAVRGFLADHGAPSDYDVPQGLRNLQLTGAGLLQWRSHPVSMICFDRGGGSMVYLFVTPRTAARDAPDQSPVIARVNRLTTASWSQGKDTYLLAGDGTEESVRSFL